jgi:1,3-beta-glucanosyltransferase GAS1
MAAFSDAGIYVWLDLDTFNTTVQQTSPTWTEDQFLAFTEVMDVFQKYDNLGGFWIGNEVINTADGSPAAPYVKAATTDLKVYMAAKKYRQIPIGYSAADIAELRPMLQNYLACGDKPNQIIDFFGLNSYEWCGDATYQSSGYSNLQAMSDGYNIPIFFSETGCNVGGERTFDDQAAIFGPDMVGTWSGSIIYEWVQETNDYGLVNYPNGQIYSGPPTPIQPDYDNLAGQWKTITPSGVALSTYTPSNSPPACPSATLGWQVNGDVPLPTLDPSLVSAAAASIKPTATPRPTTSSANPAAPTGTVTASSHPAIALDYPSSYTAMSLGLIIYPSLTPGNTRNPKTTSLTPTLTPSADLGIVANSPAASPLLSSASRALSSGLPSSVSVPAPFLSSVSDSITCPSSSLPVTASTLPPLVFSTNTSTVSNTPNSSGIAQNTSPSTSSSSPSPSTSHSAANRLAAQPDFLSAWTSFRSIGGHGGLAGAVIVLLFGSLVGGAFL